jgi:hypothetical protein
MITGIDDDVQPSEIGHAIAQAVSRRLHTAVGPGLNPGLVGIL